MRENPLLFRSEQEMGLYPLKIQNKTLKSTNTNLLNQLLFNTSFQKSASLGIKSFLKNFFLDQILPRGDFVLTEHENDFLPCQSNSDNRAAVARSSRGSNTKMFHSILFLLKDTSFRSCYSAFCFHFLLQVLHSSRTKHFCDVHLMKCIGSLNLEFSAYSAQ